MWVHAVNKALSRIHHMDVCHRITDGKFVIRRSRVLIPQGLKDEAPTSAFTLIPPLGGPLSKVSTHQMLHECVR